VIGQCYRRHRAVEFRRFLAAVEQAVPAVVIDGQFADFSAGRCPDEETLTLAMFG
jgi:hypothetical protein